MYVKRRFYCGARDILSASSNYAVETEAEAIEKAQRLLDEDPKRTEVALVQIIKVVKRRPPVLPAIVVYDVWGEC